MEGKLMLKRVTKHLPLAFLHDEWLYLVEIRYECGSGRTEVDTRKVSGLLNA